MLSSNYNDVLILFSFIVAMLASYTALDMAGRVATTQGKASRLWLAGGALSMGIGIWSMHFIGMLAFSLPVSMGYDPLITLLSMIIAIISSTFALWLVCQERLPTRSLLLGALLMGGGIAAMHYTGMAAMRMMPAISYNTGWVTLSVLMGAAIVGMHYTGMAAANFPHNTHSMAAYSGVNNNWLALLVIVVTLAVLAITLIISVLDARLQARTSVLASSLAQANRELTQLALHDNLTKLPNRLLLEDRLSQAFQKADRGDSSFALLFLDLDGFKAVNDAFGHHVGDQLLVAVTERILAEVRAADTLARLGAMNSCCWWKLQSPMMPRRWPTNWYI